MKGFLLNVRFLLFSILFVTLSALTSCETADDKEWLTTTEGYKFFGLKPAKDAIFSWDGEAVGNVINGNGSLSSYYNNGKDHTTEKITAYLGSTIKDDWSDIPGGKFLGYFEDNKPTGFGVRVKAEIVEIGEFEDGMANGQIICYVNNVLSYKGKMKNDQYNGKGILFAAGEITVAKWEDGRITHSIISNFSNQVSRMYDRVFGNIDNTFVFKETDYSNYVQGESVFCDSILSNLNDFIRDRVTETVEERTSFWSWHPIRMFWDCCFKSDNERIEEWMQAFNENGLSKTDFEGIIDNQIVQFNKLSPKKKLKSVKLKPILKEDIIDDVVFKNINDREISGWQDNIWFDLLLGFVIGFGLPFVIGFLIGILFPPALPFLFSYGWIIDFIFGAIGIIIGLVFFIYGFFNGQIEADIINGVLDNYINFINSQDILNLLR